MQIKKFYEPWTPAEVDDYLKIFNILVLFEPSAVAGQTVLRVYGNISEKRKAQLTEKILLMFGGKIVTEILCDKANEYAHKWYKKVVIGNKRVINIRRKK